MKYKILSLCLIISMFFVFILSASADGFSNGKTAQSLWNDPLVSAWTTGSGAVLDAVWDRATAPNYSESLFVGDGYFAGTRFVEVLNITMVDIDDSVVRNVTLSPGDVVIFKTKLAIATKESNAIINQLKETSLRFMLSGTFDPELGGSIVLQPTVTFSKNRNFYFRFDGYTDEWEGFTDTKGYACVYDVELSYQIPASLKSVYSPNLTLQLEFNTSLSQPLWFFFNDTTWYFGDRENAPLYSDFGESDTMDDFYSSEDQISGGISNTVDTELNGVFGSAGNIFSSTGDVFVGAAFMKRAIDFVFESSFVSSIITLSLALGVIALFFNISVAVVGKFSNRNKE